ncbi:MAG: TonB-dependent receptor plug domain-containing protein, partial [Acidobacteriota bacterium]|nr:TonB-dependent receptor plug domain-containing protein [Acidobacteriota bacterium]
MKNNFIQKIALLAFVFVCAPIAAFAQNGTVRGTITTAVNDAPLSNVSVQITQLRRSVETDENGVYEFTDVPPGRYTVVTHIEGFSDQAKTIVLTSGATGAVDFGLSLTALREEVTVTASGTEESVFESFQSVNSIGSLRIREQASTSIGEVLEREAGVGKRSFGPGTSRPIIRGFDGDRVLVTQDGIRTGSVGSQSGDHGEPIDTLSVERLEVIKGPATLLYGSNALGGVVNAVSSDENDAHEGFRGFFTGLGATNNRQGGLAGGIEYGYKKFVFNGNLSGIREGDYRTPLGRVPNSAARYTGGSGSVGYYSDKVFFQGTYGQDRRRYGVPYAPLFEEGVLLTNSGGEPCEPEEEKRIVGDGKGEPCQFDIFAIRDRFSNALPPVPDEQIDLRLRTSNYKFRGGFRNLDSFITGMNFSLNYTDYTHDEVETFEGIDEIATTFDNDTFSYRSVFEQKPYSRLTGRFGFEGFTRDYQTVGAEALVQGKVKHNMFSVFALEEFN